MRRDFRLEHAFPEVENFFCLVEIFSGIESQVFGKLHQETQMKIVVHGRLNVKQLDGMKQEVEQLLVRFFFLNGFAQDFIEEKCERVLDDVERNVLQYRVASHFRNAVQSFSFFVVNDEVDKRQGMQCML